MNSDWNGDGKHGWQDSYMDEKLSSSNSTSSGGGGSSSGNGGCMTLGCSTFLLLALFHGIASGTMDVENPYTFVFAGILILIIWYCVSKKN